ncbi:MAG: NUDIX hydrolase [bacterium]
MSSYIDWIRNYVGHNKLLLVFASACIRDDNGRLLWQRRSDFDWWGLPGGILELGESLSECIVREVREETGLEVEPSRLVGIYSSPDFDVTYPNGDLVQQVTACFDCRIVGGKLMPDKNEILDLAWFPMDEIPSTSPWYLAMVKDLALGKKTAAFD